MRPSKSSRSQSRWSGCSVSAAHRVGDGVARGVVAGHREQHEERADLRRRSGSAPSTSACTRLVIRSSRGLRRARVGAARAPGPSRFISASLATSSGSSMPRSSRTSGSFARHQHVGGLGQRLLVLLGQRPSGRRSSPSAGAWPPAATKSPSPWSTQLVDDRLGALGDLVLDAADLLRRERRAARSCGAWCAAGRPSPGTTALASRISSRRVLELHALARAEESSGSC